MMAMLDQVKNPEKQIKIGLHNVRLPDLNGASVTAIYDELLHIIRKENPQIVEQMLKDYAIIHDQ